MDIAAFIRSISLYTYLPKKKRQHSISVNQSSNVIQFKVTIYFIALVLSKGQPCSTALASLKSELDIILDGPETNPFDTEEYTSCDVEETCPIIQQVDSDHEGNSDIEIDWKSETY